MNFIFFYVHLSLCVFICFHTVLFHLVVWLYAWLKIGESRYQVFGFWNSLPEMRFGLMRVSKCWSHSVYPLYLYEYVNDLCFTILTIISNTNTFLCGTFVWYNGKYVWIFNSILLYACFVWLHCFACSIQAMTPLANFAYLGWSPHLSILRNIKQLSIKWAL